jgi:hypothetical protein
MTSGHKEINAYRDGAFHMEVGDTDDASPIADMLPIGGRMHIIKAEGIYRIELPDSIDPGRTNAKLPSTQQRVLARGANDVLVGRTLLLTMELCRDGILVAHVNVDRAMVSALEFLKEMSAANEVVAQFEKDEKSRWFPGWGMSGAPRKIALALPKQIRFGVAR